MYVWKTILGLAVEVVMCVYKEGTEETWLVNYTQLEPM